MHSNPVVSLVVRLAAVCLAMASVAVEANHDLILAFDAGVVVCVIGGTPPDNCDFDATNVVSGSWWAMDSGGTPGVIDDNEKVAISVGSDGGITIGHAQSASGSHSGSPTGAEVAPIDAPWVIFANTGMHESLSPVDFLTNTTLDFSGWTADWNGIEVPLGGDSVTYPAEIGEATISCTNSPCASGDLFTLDYSAHVPAGDPSGFGGTYYELYLEGTITTLAPVETTNTGLTSAVSAATTIGQAELEYTDDIDGAANVSYSVTSGLSYGQLEFTTLPGNSILAFTQDDINNNRLVYVHGGSTASGADSFGFTVTDSGTNTNSGNTFNIEIDLPVSITTEPKNVKAAVEWLPTSLANTSALAPDPEYLQVNVGNVGASGVIRIDLPAQGNRRMVSDASTGTGAAFMDPRTAVIDEVNNRAIVSDNALPGLVAVNLATGNRTVLSQGSVAGTGPAFTGPGRLRLDAANNRILVSDSVKIIAADLTTGNRSIISDNSGSFGTGPNFQQIRGVAVDTANSRLLVADELLNAVLAVDPVTGDRTLFSDINNGTGTLFSNLRDVIVDVPNDRALVSDNALDAVFAVDLTTGNRTVISQFSTSTGTGPDFGNPTHFALDVANQRLLVACYENFAVYAMDLLTGDRSIISSNATTAGPLFVRQRGIVLQASDQRALVVDTDGQALLSVDLSPNAGQRTIFSHSTLGVGTGPSSSAIDVVVDRENNRALMTGVDSVLAVDLDSGDRTVISDSVTGSGPVIGGATPRLVLDSDANLVYVVDALDRLLSVDLSTGDRVLIADNAGLGTGPWGNNPTDIVLDESGNRVLVVQYLSQHILSIDLTTGNRVILSDNTGVGSGPVFDYPISIQIDEARSRALVADQSGYGRILAVDLATGDRSIVADNVSVGSGPSLGEANKPLQYLAIDPVGDRVYASDKEPKFYAVDLATGDRILFPSSGVPDSDSPLGLDLDAVHGRVIYASQPTLGGLYSADIYDPVFGTALAAAPFSVSPSYTYGLTAGGAGESYAEWTNNTGAPITGPVTLTLDNVRLELTGAPVGEVIDYTITKSILGGPTGGTVQSGPAFTMVNAITATVTPSSDTLDAAQGNLFFDDGIGDAISSDFLIEIQNNAMLNNLGEAELVVRLLGDFTGISNVSASVESGVFRAYTSTSGNFTVLDPNASLIGGTNDVTATWDGSLNTAESDTNFNMSAASASNQPFFGFPWVVHHARMFGPGTYDFDSDCTYVDIEAGNSGFNSCGDGPNIPLTVGAGQIGAHMLFDWNVSTDIHVAMVWDVGSASDFESGGSGALYTGGAGSASAGQLYELISRDDDGDGAQGIPMVNGPFIDFSLNFNLDLFAGDGLVDEFTVPVGQGRASAFLIDGIAEESTKSFHLHLELDGTTIQTPRNFTARVDVLSADNLVAPDVGIAGLDGAVAATFNGSPDTDGDGLMDSIETGLGTDINDTDSDDDGISDFDEVDAYGETSIYDAGFETDPNNADTDGDGFLDGGEAQFGSDPLSAGSTPGSPLRVTTNSAGDEARGETSSTSADGRYIAFESNATNLSASDTNGDLWDIFVKDTQTGITTLISTDSSGNGANGESFNPVISADGRYVVFDSGASNLVAGDNNGVKDIFIKDTVTGVSERLSVDTAGNEGNANSLRPDISADGRFVVFDSLADDLIASDTNSASDIFIRDTLNDTTTRLSVDSAGSQGSNGDGSFRPRISADGHYVVFSSNATNLVAGDTNELRDIFMRDTQDDVTSRISQDTAGSQAMGGWSYSPAISADGRYVTFYSQATNLVAGDSNAADDIFLRDTLGGTTIRISTDSSGTQANGSSALPKISADGRYIVFDSLANNLVGSDGNGVKDVFVKDVWTGTTVRLSTTGGGSGGNAQSHTAAISADAAYVIFESDANNLVAGDSNSTTDVFRAVQSLFSPDTDGDGLRDDVEIVLGTDIDDIDSDEDGISDYDEVSAYGSPYSYDAGFETDPNNSDTDGDGFLDGGEVHFGSDPLSAGSTPGSPLRVNTTANGTEGDANAGATNPQTSADGRYVVFNTTATNLVPGDTNGVEDVFIKDVQTGEIDRFSIDTAGNEGNQRSERATISADVSYVVFESQASNLVANDTNGVSDIFLRNTDTDVTSRISTDSAGVQGNGISRYAVISADGRYVAFESSATNLVANDTNGNDDIFVKDIQTGVTTRVSTDSADSQVLSGGNATLAISADGNFVVFGSSANDLVAGDTNGTSDLFMKNRQTGATIRISTGTGGTEANGTSNEPAISADGRFVAFKSTASNLVAGDTNGFREIFLKDTLTDITTRVSTDSAGMEVDNQSGQPAISADGRYVVFGSSATNLVAGDTNGSGDVFLKDTLTGVTKRISVDSLGVEANSTAASPAISADAHYVVFGSFASNLVPEDTNGSTDVFRAENPEFIPDTDGDGLRDDVETTLGTDINDADGDDDGLSDFDEVNGDNDPYNYTPGTDTDPFDDDTDDDGFLDGGEVQFGSDPLSAGSVPGSPLRMSTDSAGVEGDDGSGGASISLDGRYVAFASIASNLVAGDANGSRDVFIKDVHTGITTRVSTDSGGGAEGDNHSYDPVLSADGRYVAFVSDAANLVAGDTNAFKDAFVKDTQTGITTRVSTDSGGLEADGDSWAAAVSDDGRYVLFDSDATNLVPGITNTSGFTHAYLKDTQTGAIFAISTDSSGIEGNQGGEGISISADGRYALFSADSSNLVTGDLNNSGDIFLKDTQTGVTTRISTNSVGAEGNGNSTAASMSADSRYIAFHSIATNLVVGDTVTDYDVFIKDTLTGITTLVSTDSSGVKGNDHTGNPVISADGRYVVFDSYATNLVAGDGNGLGDIFVKDTLTGVTSRLNTSSVGVEANSFSWVRAISNDGHYVAFESEASNLVAGDNNTAGDVFRVDNPEYVQDTDGDGLRDDIETSLGTDINLADTDGDGISDFDEVNGDFDPASYTPGTDTDPLDSDTDDDGFLDGGEVQYGSDPLSAVSLPDSPLLMSTDSAGDAGDAGSIDTAVSSDGRYVVFRSAASDLVAGDTNNREDIFIKDRQTGVTRRVSVSSTGLEGDDDSFEPVISGDGRYVVFRSDATNIVTGDNNGVEDIFLRDTQTNTTTRLSVDILGLDSNGGSFAPAISADGRYVVFHSLATDLVADDINGVEDIFLRDTQTSTTVRLSVDSGGLESDGGSFDAVISEDNRYVVFWSDASNLVAGDTNTASDIFIRDMQANTTTRVSTDSAGIQSNGHSFEPVISSGGRYIAFASEASNLVAGDLNTVADVYVKDMLTGNTERVSTDSAGLEADGDSVESTISADGRYVAFGSIASNLVAGGTNGAIQLYIKDRVTNSTTRVSVDSVGVEGNADSSDSPISADGRYIAFESLASNLVAGDANSASDIFLAENPSFSPDTDGDGLRDDVETILGTSTSNTDSDEDGLSDYDEVNADNDPSSYTPGTDTDPLDADTDDDGFLDGGEVQFGSDPLSVGSVPGSTIRVSTDSAGVEGDALSYISVVSADGRYVAFESDATNLVTGDTNGASDIFIKDTQTGITTRVSTDTNGVEADAASYSAAISGDGRYVAFRSQASNLVAGDTNGTWDVFVKDTQTGITTRVSTDSGGIQGNNASDKPVISTDGRYVAFSSPASNLVASDNNPTWDVFLKDTQTGTTTRVSIDSAELDANGASDKPAISADGRYVAFYSWSTNLVSGDTNGFVDIFIRDTQTGDTIRASTDGAGLQGNGDSFDPVLSADGRYVAFKSSASNLVPGDLNSKQDIFLKDTQTGVITRVSTDSAGAEGSDNSLFPDLSADGRYVAFSSYASNLVAGDTNGQGDVFVKDTLTGVTTRVNTDSGGAQGNGYGTEPAISADGSYVTFASLATNLVAGDTNVALDVFRAENPEFSPDTDGDGVRDDTDVFPNDPNEALDTDGDGIGNNADPDDDNDGMPDSFELAHGLDPLDPSDASADADGDGYDNESEFRAGTDPNNNGESPGTVAALHYKILANDSSFLDAFGWGVDIDGDTALIGASGADTSKGAAYVYVRDGSGNWNLQQKLTAADGEADDYFGGEVTIDGNTALIGAAGDDDNGEDAGAVYVFTRSGTAWTQQVKLTASDGVAFDYLGDGGNLALDGGTALIGTSWRGGGTGAVYVFTGSGASWNEQVKLTASDGAVADYFGYGVALDNGTAVIAAGLDDDNGPDSGSVYIFTGSGASWTQRTKLTASDGAQDDQLGYGTVSIDGDTVVVGSQGDDDLGAESGSVYVFTGSGASWVEQAKLGASDGAAGDAFGYDVALSGNTVLISTPYNDDKGSDAGAAYVFVRDGQGSWSQHQTLTAQNGSADDFFGWWATLSGDRALVSAPYDDDNGLDAGAAFLFELTLPPVANNDTDTVGEGASKVLYLATNDSDDNGDLDLTSIVITSQPTNRATDVVVNANGTVYYTHDGSETTSDSFTYTINDLNGTTSTVATVDLAITAVNDAPALDLDGTVAGVNFSTTFTEGGGGIAVVDSDASLDDPDSGDQIESAFFSISSPTAEDVLYVQGGQAALDLINSNIIWVGVETPDQPFVALSGAATPAEYLAAMQLVRYNNSSSQPDIPPTRTVTVSVDDGEASSAIAAANITINSVNSDFTTTADVFSVDEDTTNNTLNLTGNDFDPDGTQPTISEITTPPTNGTATISVDRHSIRYTPNPNFSGAETQIIYSATDGEFFNPGTVDITVTGQNDVPALDLDGAAGGTGFSTAFTEGSGAVQLTGGAVITDFDSPDMKSATIALNPRRAGDLLFIQGTATSLPAGITAVEAGDGSYILLSGSPLAPTASWQTALDLIRFENGLVGPDVTQRSVVFVVNDDNDAVSPAAFTTIDIVVNDDPPALDLDADGAGTGYATNFVTGQGSSGVGIVDSDVSIIDDGALISGASVNITNAESGDALMVGTLPGSITANIISNASVTLSGDASAADYQMALTAFDFTNTLSAPLLTPRVINISVTDDGSNTSNTATTTIAMAAAPIVDLNGTDAGEAFSTRFTPGSVSAVNVADTDAEILDADNGNLTQLAVTITNPAPGDELTVDTVQLSGWGIAVDASSTTTYKLLTGDVSKLNYILALRSIGYLNSEVVPDPTARLIRFVATDTDLHQGKATVTTVGIGSDFAITFDPLPEIVLADAALAYTINVTNVGGATASDLVLTSVLDEDAFITDMRDPDSVGWDCNDFQSGANPTAVCSLPSLAQGATVSLTVEIMTPSVTREIINSITVSNSDPLLGTGTASQTNLVVNFLDGTGFLPEEKLTDTDGTTVYADTGADFGSSMVLREDILIVGSPDDYDGLTDSNGVQSGAVAIYRRTPAGWIQQTRLVKPGAHLSGDGFGASVAWDGNWLVVGSPGVGEVHVYDAAFANPQTLSITDGTGSAGSGYGQAVAISNSRIAVGAPGADINGTNNGRVYLFEENAGAWAQTASVDSDQVSGITGISADNSDFGLAVALDGDRLVIGAPYENGPVSQGVALLYEYTGGSWVYQQALLKPTIDKPDAFGRSLDISGDSIVVGAMFHDSGHPDSGAAHVFTRDASGNWNHDQKLVASNAISGEEFGVSVDIQGDTMLVGAYNGLNPIPNFVSGVGYVFQRTGSVWNEQQIISATDAALNDRFGMAVAMDGDRIALGAPADDDNTLMESGSVYILRIRTNPADKLVAFDRTVDAKFGTTLAVSGNTLVVGAPYHDHLVADNDNKGAAYVYRRANDSWQLEQQLLASNAANDDHFGWSVAISGDRIVVGAPDRDGTFANSGTAYTFSRIGEIWIEQQQLAGQTPDTADRFGAAVAIDGNRIAVGVPGAAATIMSIPLVDAGVVEVFDFASTWTYQETLVASAITTGLGHALDVEGDIIVAAASNINAYVFENDGGWAEQQILGGLSTAVTSVSLFGDQVSSAPVPGDTLVLGSAQNDDMGADAGAVNSYSWNGTGWIDDGKLYADDATDNDRFGASLSLFGDQLLVGAPGNSEAANAAGAAYLYKAVGGTWVQRGRILANDAEQDDALGGGSPTAVAINLDGRVVGAYLEDVDGSGTNYGAVYTSFTTPTSSLPSGSFSANQLVTLDCDDCAAMYYTTNGSTPTTASTEYTGAITIEAVGGLTTTTEVKFIAVDSQGNSGSEQTTSLLIDVEDPTVVIDPASPYQNGAVVGSALLPIQGMAADEAGGSGLRMVQLELRDAAGQYVLIDGNGVFQGMTSTQTWLNATTTDDWATWALPMTTVPFAEEGSYSLRVRGNDQSGNVSDVIATGFTYFTGTSAFMTLDLNISASSILNVPGDSPTGEGEIDVSVKLTDPSDLGTDLTGSSISLEITDPNAVVTSIPLVTNVNGQQTLQDLGDGSVIDFNVEGTWTIRAHYPGTSTRNSADSEPLTLLVGQSAGSAVIVVGRIGGGNEGLESHNKTGKRIYDTLISRGFQPQDIEFYSPDTNRDGTIDGLDGTVFTDGIDAIPSRANVQAAIEGMAVLSNANPAPRYVFMVDHGNPGQFLLNDAESIMPNDLDNWLDNQESTLAGGALAKPSVVVLGMCYSGSFLHEAAVDDFSNPSPVDRLVIASAAETEESYKGTEESDGIRVGEFFLEEFVKEAGRGATLKGAFEYATAQAEIFTRKSDIAAPDPVFNDVAAQHPLLEDNRLFDPVDIAANNLLKVSAGADGALADTLFLGVGPTYATNAVNNPADILTVTDTVFLAAGEDSRLLTLTANDDTKVASAWVEVRAPATQLLPSGGTNSNQLDPILTRSIMNPPVTDVLESWFTTYDQFMLSGKYEVFYFVQDATSGEISPIRRSVVYRNTAGNGDPGAPALLLPADMAITDNGILFDWSASIDPEADPVTYTLEITTDDTFATVDYRDEEITDTYTYVGPEAGLQDLTTYYWRVIAVDAFGGQGVSGSFSFTTELTNALRGVVFATVTNAISDVTLQGATVTAVNASGDTVAPLEATYMTDGAGGTFYRKYPGGVYDITISDISGFAPATEEGIDVSVNQKSYATVLPEASADADGDGIEDSVEIVNGTNPNSVDSDQDGIVDGAGGVVLVGDYPVGGGYPVPVDTDGDGYVDGEQDFGNDPTVSDFADGNIGPYPTPDTVLNIADYLVATRIVLGSIPIAPDSPAALGHIDMNADGAVNAGDLVLLLKAIQSQ